MATLRWDQRDVVTGSAALGVILVCGLPLVWVATALARITWMHDASAVDVFETSVQLSFLSSVVAVLLGSGTAMLLNRISVRAQRAFLLLLSVPLFLPSYLHALAWSSVVASDFATEAAINTRWTTRGAIISMWVLAVSYFPVATLLLFATMRRWNRRLDWAVWVHGRGIPAAYLLRARFFCAPFSAAGLIIFLLTFADFAVPDFFQVRTYATDIFVQVSSYLDISAASVLSVPVIITAIVAFAVLVRLLGRMTVTTTSADFFGESRRESLLSHYAAVVLLGCLSFGLVILPLAELIREVRSLDVLADAFYMIWKDAARAAGIAAACAMLAVMLSTFAAYGCDRGIRPAGSWLRFLPVAMLAIPTSLIGLASIDLWNRPYPIGWLYDTGIALVLAITARWLPVSFEMIAQGWRHCGPVQEAAGMTSGRSWIATFFRVLIRPMQSVVLAALFVTFVFAFNELTLVTLLAPPGFSTLPLRLFQTIHYGPDSLLAAICVWQVVVLMLPLAALATVLRHR